MSVDCQKNSLLIIFVQIGLLLATVTIAWLYYPGPGRTCHRMKDDYREYLDRYEKLIRKDPHTIIVTNDDIGWLRRLQLNDSKCYAQDDLTLFMHYCEDEAHYPILYDVQCVPHSIDHYRKLIAFNQTNDRMVEKFVASFDKLIHESFPLRTLIENHLERAANYSKKIGHDCQHPSIWRLNFDPKLPSASNDHELWQLYCQHRIIYPNLVSINSGKYYVPGYYQQRIEKGLQPDEEWMQLWMQDRFLPYYQNESILQNRYRKELKQAQMYAQVNELKC